MQDHERTGGAASTGLPKAFGSPVGRGEGPAKAGGQVGEEAGKIELEMAEQEAIGLLEQLARDFNVRDPRKLFQIAGREFPDRRDLTSARAAAALRGDVARQVLAPKPRSLGKSAAEGPNDRLQADLVDFSQNTRGRNKYGLVVQDVFTREIATKALPDKRAAAEIIPDLVQEEGNYVVTTDMGNEFRGLEAALPGGAVHRQKDPSDRNATAVVDRAIQTLKKDLAGMVARRGGRLGRTRGRSSGGLQCPATPGGHGGAGGREDDADSNLPSLSGQRNQVPAQQEAYRRSQTPIGRSGRIQSSDKCKKKLQTAIRTSSRNCKHRFHGCSGHRWNRNFAKACTSRSERQC